MLILQILLVYLTINVHGHGTVVTFQELVCQHCNALHGPDEESSQITRPGKAGPRGFPGPRGPPGLPGKPGQEAKINEIMIREIVREEIEIALEVFQNKSRQSLKHITESGEPTDNPWTVFQRRVDGSVNFYREWNDYVFGFGDPNGEFWLGLEKLYQLTKSGEHELRIDMREINGSFFRAGYRSFRIGSTSDNYRLHVDAYFGNATDSLWNPPNIHGVHNGHQFTTKDSDHDLSSDNCAQSWKGGWWYNNCHYSNLNGLYNTGPADYKGIAWRDTVHNDLMIMRYTEMKTRKIMPEQ